MEWRKKGANSIDEIRECLRDISMISVVHQVTHCRSNLYVSVRTIGVGTFYMKCSPCLRMRLMNMAIPAKKEARFALT